MPRYPRGIGGTLSSATADAVPSVSTFTAPGTITPLSSVFARRRFLHLVGGGTILFAFGGLLEGCGSGGGNRLVTSSTASSGSTSGATFTFNRSATLARPQPTGTFTQQINQYSQAVADFGHAFDDSAADYSSLANALQKVGQSINLSSAVPIAHDDTTRHTSRQTAPANTPSIADLANATAEGINTATAHYQTTASALVYLDTMGYLGDITTSQNNLIGDASVSNPQFNLAIAEKLVARLNACAGFIQSLSKLGIDDMVKEALAVTDPGPRVARYVIVAYFFNTWVKSVYQNVGLPVDAASLLKDSPDSYEDIDTELGRVAGILPVLPMGLPYLAAINATRAAHSGRAIDQNFRIGQEVGAAQALATYASKELAAAAAAARNSANGVITLPPVPEGPTPDTLIQLTKDGLSKATKIASGAAVGALAQGAAEYIFDQLKASTDVTTELYATFTKCGIDLIFGTTALVATAGATVVSSPSVAGPIVFGSLTVANATLLGLSLANCGDDIAKALEDYRKASQRNPSGNNIPSKSPYGYEYDQVANAVGGSGSASGASGGGRATGQEADFNIEGITADEARAVVLGTLAGGGPYPRTFTNVQNAAVALVYDMAKRSPDLTHPSVYGNTVTFLRSNLAVLLERQQNETVTPVPPITDALLLCTGINLTPMRNTDPVDLTGPNASLPALQPLGELGTGVNANVK